MASPLTEKASPGTTTPSSTDHSIRNENTALEALGYTPELRRSFSTPGIIAFSFSIVTCWTALSGVLIVGVSSGGPPVMIWSWLAVCAFTLAVAYSMAEMCSAYPVAGGQYSWVAVFAPKPWRRGLSYVCGWFMLIGILAMGATNSFITANFILGLAVLNNPAYVIERWHTVLVAYAVCVFTLVVNVFVPKLLDKISRGLLIWNIGSFIIVIVTLLATNDHKQSASFVFADFVNFSGWNPAYTAIYGLLQTAFGMCCYDAPAHMTEEIKHARRRAPQAIIYSVYLGTATGFIFLITACFSMPSISAAASTPTLVPMIAILQHSTGSVPGTSVLTLLFIVICVGAGNALTAEGGRAIFAFARDEGLPFSKFLARVERKRSVPVVALAVTVAVQMALESIYFGTVTGFNTVISISTEGFYISYALPLLARLLSTLPLPMKHHTPTHHTITGSSYPLGALSIPLNAIGLFYLLFCSITFNFPGYYPVDSENMNYTCAAVGLIMAISAVTWAVTGRKRFRGPVSGGVVVGGDGGEGGEIVAVKGDDDSEGEGKEGKGM